MKKLIIAVDFDGVIAEINDDGSLEPRNLVKDADVYLRKLYDEGHTLILWTCRSAFNLYLAEKFIEEHNIKFHKINDNADTHYEHFKHNSRKVYADLYVDDKQVCGLPSWAKIYNFVQKLSNSD